MDVCDQLYDFYSKYDVIRFEYPESALAEDVFSADEFFYHLKYKDKMSFSRVKIMRTSELSYYDKNSMFNIFGNFVRIIDSEGIYLDLKLAMNGLFYVLGDIVDYSITYNTNKYYNYFDDSEIETTDVYVNGYCVMSLKYYQSYFKQHSENIQTVLQYNLDLIAILLGDDKYHSISPFSQYGVKNIEFTRYIIDDTSTENENIILDADIAGADLHFREGRLVLSYLSLVKSVNILDIIKAKTGMYSDSYRGNLERISNILNSIRTKLLDGNLEGGPQDE